jgi:integral membrane protein
MLKFFRIITLLEGVSYLFLLLVSMPLKYSGVTEVPTKTGGMVHGVLFIIYMLLIIPMAKKMTWNFKTMFIVGIASVIPFGTFYIDKIYLKK